MDNDLLKVRESEGEMKKFIRYNTFLNYNEEFALQKEFT
jgi:hypothetical protein